MPFPQNGPNNGIVSLFIQNVPNYNDIIKVTSSTNQERAQSVLNPIDGDHSWGGVGEGEQFIQFEFSESFIDVVSYSITSTINDQGESYLHLKGWDFLGSRNGFDWYTLDTVRDSDELNCMTCTKYFECDHKGVYKFFKIVQKQLRDSKYNGFGIRKFEIFGTLYDDPKIIPIKYCSQNVRHIKINYSCLCYIFLLLK